MYKKIVQKDMNKFLVTRWAIVMKQNLKFWLKISAFLLKYLTFESIFLVFS